jgi:hypothetical protein
LEYGGGRLIDVREGPNVRLSFTGFRILSKVGSWHADGFAVRPDVDNFGFFDNVQTLPSEDRGRCVGCRVAELCVVRWSGFLPWGRRRKRQDRRRTVLPLGGLPREQAVSRSEPGHIPLQPVACLQRDG